MCTLKGACQCTLFDVGGVEIHSIECIEYCTKDQSSVKGVKGTLYGFQCIKCYIMLCMSKTVKMVFVGFYATLYTEYYYSCQRCHILCTVLCIQRPLAPPRGKAI